MNLYRKFAEDLQAQPQKMVKFLKENDFSQIYTSSDNSDQKSNSIELEKIKSLHQNLQKIVEKEFLNNINSGDSRFRERMLKKIKNRKAEKEENYWDYSSYLTLFCSENIDLWFDAEKFDWKESYYLAAYCSENFDLWFDPKKFDWSYAHSLKVHCSNKKRIWKKHLKEYNKYLKEYNKCYLEHSIEA